MTLPSSHHSLMLHQRVDQVLGIIATTPGQFARFSTIRARLFDDDLFSDSSIKLWCRSALAHGYAQIIVGSDKADPIYRLTELGTTRLPEALRQAIKAKPSGMAEQVAAIAAQRHRVSLADAFEAGLRQRAQAAAAFPSPTGPSVMTRGQTCKPKRPSRAQAERDNTASSFCTPIPGAADALRTMQIRGSNSWVS